MAKGPKKQENHRYALDQMPVLHFSYPEEATNPGRPSLKEKLPSHEGSKMVVSTFKGHHPPANDPL